MNQLSNNVSLRWRRAPKASAKMDRSEARKRRGLAAIVMLVFSKALATRAVCINTRRLKLAPRKWKALGALFLLVWCWSAVNSRGASASGYFKQINVIPRGGAFDLGDIDGDGDLDIVTSTGGALIEFWINEGGRFTLADQTIQGTNLSLIRLADLDGDDRLDLYVTRVGAPYQVWRNTGAGRFVFHSEFDPEAGIGPAVSSPLLADVDGDGKLDSIVSYFNSPARVFPNDGNGRFLSSRELPGIYSVSAAVDIDGDGHPDLVASDSAMRMSFWRNDGTGHFTLVKGAPSLLNSYGFGDFDGDGDVDVLGSQELFVNNGLSNFVSSPIPAPMWGVVALADVDGDGSLDAFVRAANFGTFTDVWINNGSGRFTPSGQQLYTFGTPLLIGDINGDGAVDAVGLTADGKQIAVWMNNDKEGPSAVFDPVFPDIRITPVDYVTVLFSEPVHFEIGDVSLFRDGSTNLISVQQSVSLDPILYDLRTRFRINELSPITAQPGHYTLAIGGGHGAISDAAGNKMRDVFTVSWEVTREKVFRILDAPGSSRGWPFGTDVTGVALNYDPRAVHVAGYIFISGLGWWTKPTFANPVVGVDPVAETWSFYPVSGGIDICAIKFAAVLLPIDVLPPPVAGAEELPPELFVNALASDVWEKGFSRRIGFSGLSWQVKTSCGGRIGPGNNLFSDDPASVWVDSLGFLHLISATNAFGFWQSVEVLTKGFGYGRYVFEVQGAPKLDPNLVFSGFIWDDDPAEAHREIDIVEVSKWGTPNNPFSAQSVRQPFSEPGNLYRFNVREDSELTTFMADWQTNRIVFKSWVGPYELEPAATNIVHQWVYTNAASVPSPGNESMRFNLWVAIGSPISAEPKEVVIRAFKYYPPDRPSLELKREAGTVQLRWLANFSDFRLQEASQLDGPWVDVVEQPEQLGGVLAIELSFSDGRRFFRLAR